MTDSFYFQTHSQINSAFFENFRDLNKVKLVMNLKTQNYRTDSEKEVKSYNIKVKIRTKAENF